MCRSSVRTRPHSRTPSARHATRGTSSEHRAGRVAGRRARVAPGGGPSRPPTTAGGRSRSPRGSPAPPAPHPPAGPPRPPGGISPPNAGGGSPRTPAGFGALVGLKPSRGRVGAPEQISRYPAQLAVPRTVRDAAAILDAVHGDVPGQLLVAPPPAGRYVDELTVDPGRLRIGLLADSAVFDGAPPTDAECVAGARATATVLESLGHHVEDAWPRALLDMQARRATGATWAGGGINEHNMFVARTGREPTEEDVEPFTWARWQRAQTISLRDYLKASNAQQEWALDVVQWWSEFDLLLTPTTGEPAPTIEEMRPDPDEPWRIDKRYARIAVFTMPFNVTGQPAISLPLAATAAGLPVGVQLVAAPFREDLLIRVAAQLEQAAPWADRRPPLHA